MQKQVISYGIQKLLVLYFFQVVTLMENFSEVEHMTTHCMLLILTPEKSYGVSTLAQMMAIGVAAPPLHMA